MSWMEDEVKRRRAKEEQKTLIDRMAHEAIRQKTAQLDRFWDILMEENDKLPEEIRLVEGDYHHQMHYYGAGGSIDRHPPVSRHCPTDNIRISIHRIDFEVHYQDASPSNSYYLKIRCESKNLGFIRDLRSFAKRALKAICLREVIGVDDLIPSRFWLF